MQMHATMSSSSSSSTHINLFLVPITVMMICSWTASPSPASVVESLPGFGHLPFRLETGYVGVGDDVQLFYYFIESEGNPGKDPLLLWLTGGPGCSGISGLLYEIGPLRFVKAEYNGTIPSLVPNPYSWTKVSSIIFVDAPVGTGFSYAKSTEGYETGDTAHAGHCHDFLKKWLMDHPRFIGHPIYIAGDSYSGMIVPLIAQYIIQESNDFTREVPIDLKGYLLGNPATDPDFDKRSKLTFAYHRALIPKDLYESTKKSCRDKYWKQLARNSLLCERHLQFVSLCTELVNHAHILEPKCRGFRPWRNSILEDGRKHLAEESHDADGSLMEIPEFRCRSYFDVLCHVYANDPIVQEHLHVRKDTPMGPWIRCNRSLSYDQDVTSTISQHQYLNRRGCRALIYSGDQDMVIPYLGTQSWIESMNLPIIDEWRPWTVEDQVAGYVRSYENHLTFATVKGGGHTAPEYLPKACFAMYRRWISGESL